MVIKVSFCFIKSPTIIILFIEVSVSEKRRVGEGRVKTAFVLTITCSLFCQIV